MRAVWTTVKELKKMSQETRNNLAVNFGRRIVPLNDIDLDVYAQNSSLPIIFDEEPARDTCN